MDMEARQMAVEVMRETGYDLEYCAGVVEEYLQGREGEDLSQDERELVVENSIANINSGTRDDDVEHRADCECECAAIDGDDENPTFEWQHDRHCECDCGAI